MLAKNKCQLKLIIGLEKTSVVAVALSPVNEALLRSQGEGFARIYAWILA